ncbi:hypothetical protein C0081_02455 [Cohaesibacter celericrescens]|uniref:Uncharacterized protein n=1 Tax=Cohaesibacter celericrescens TaxID=2067669 RepID=A0A2N5XX70_9HYPH|nr:hypothetical protein C0081_02455 [Cohaesibacter celericrescens]
MKIEIIIELYEIGQRRYIRTQLHKITHQISTESVKSREQPKDRICWLFGYHPKPKPFSLTKAVKHGAKLHQAEPT